MVMIVQEPAKEHKTMAAFKRILFPVEFSPSCQDAARSVAAYARHFEAEVILLHIEVPPFDVPYYWESQTERLTQMLDRFLVDEFRGLKTQRFVGAGDPSHEIVRYANAEKADLIMMPTRGRGTFRRFVLG